MDPEHAAMVDLAMRWLPFEGPPPAEILVTFGLTPAAYYRRLLLIDDNPTAPAISGRLRMLAQKKLTSDRTASAAPALYLESWVRRAADI